MKKLAIIAVVLIGGGIFAGYMVETKKQVKEPKTTVEQSAVIKVATTQAKDTKAANQISSHKANSETSNIKKSVENTTSTVDTNTNLRKNVDNSKSQVLKGAEKNTSNSLNLTNSKSDETTAVKQGNTSKSSMEKNTQNINSNSNSNNKSKVEVKNPQEPKIQTGTDSHNVSKVTDITKKQNTINNSAKNSNTINDSAKASDLVKEYYKNKYPSINESNWSTDVSENQTIDGKTGYLVRLYNYMNNHSNNIAWILVEPNGNMYSTEAGSGPISKLN